MCENCKQDEMEKNFIDEKVDLKLIHPIVEKYGQVKGSLINMLQEIQEVYGYLPLSAMEYIADNTNNKKATIYGVATFYTQFRLHPIGKNLILQCQGTACHVNGSREISKALCNELEINPGETTKDGLFTIEDVACLGCCSLAPVIMINGEAYGNLTPKEAVKIIRKIKKDEEEVINEN
ncbi:NADH-quinone oxidoreductase subunit NuoE [Helicovermis profundi]|uniref:NADH-quinone oxidoreductase subunit NuoE n=1 Tax=Helicovermis profundi TaxID=3065157 RepID=A0AAU9E2W2_9FIRM|nr:NADH-quinone oxidoreductase subunit NuoE [Clostridia bacterium S502]